jgi:hypothetical protein
MQPAANCGAAVTKFPNRVRSALLGWGVKDFPMTVIKLSDERATALKAKAAAEGLSLMTWLQKLAEQKRPARYRHITSVILKNISDVRSEIMATMPKHGASQHDHYIYGCPKREA